MVSPFFATAEKGAGGRGDEYMKHRAERGGCGGEYMQPEKMVNRTTHYYIMLIYNNLSNLIGIISLLHLEQLATSNKQPVT